MEYPFLSQAWMSEARDLHDDFFPAVAELGLNAKINLTMTDPPLTDAPTELFIEVTPERATFEVGHLPEADVDVTMSYPLARELLTSGELDNALHEIITGGIQVEGDYGKLIEFGGVMATDGALITAELGRRLREFTDLYAA